jgi:hypothetical protein
MVRDVGMDRLRQFLEAVRKQGTATGHFRGLLHLLIGRRISLPEGEVVSGGMTWRELAGLLKKVRWDREAVQELGLDPAALPPRDREKLAGLLKKVRWDREAVQELGLDPAALPPRDREKFWYLAISRAGVLTPEASASADELVEALRALGYVVGPAPGATVDQDEE